MRISDWSSDVCSSDLPGKTVDRWRAYQANEYGHIALECALNGLIGLQCESYTNGIEPRQLVAKLVDEAIPQNTSTWSDWADALVGLADNDEALHAEIVLEHLRRTEARRVGKECVSQVRTRWLP